MRLASQFRKEVWLSPEGLPASSPSTLMSSSRSSQCIPWPFPTRRQLVRSDFEAWLNRGYHAKGTDIVLPSLRSTLKVSSVTLMFSAADASISIMEVSIPASSPYAAQRNTGGVPLDNTRGSPYAA